jgi:hypothetical protein
MAAAAALVAIALLVGCKRKAEVHRPPDLMEQATQAAEASIRSAAKTSDGVTFRGVQVYRQAIAGQFAVCGQANVFGGTSETFVLFVALATIASDRPGSAPHFLVTQQVAETPADATRVYVATIARCFDKGGPEPSLRGDTTPVPPLPEGPDRAYQPEPSPPVRTAAPARPPAPIPPPPPQAASAPAPAGDAMPSRPAGQELPLPAMEGTVTMLQNGNLHATPQGEVVRVVPKGTTLSIFGEAPGGWYEVGDTSPWGWVHSSLVERH